MTDDRELLEAAAKAAGIEGKWCRESYIERREGFIPCGWRRAWNPRDDDGDALRLAVALRMEVTAEPQFVVVITEDAQEFVEHGADRFAATRLAILRAAAEIGKAMP